MAERVGKIPRRNHGNRSPYPWNEWFDGSVWELVQGKDFQCLPVSMVTIVRRTGDRLRVDVVASIRGDRVYIQAER